MPCYSPYRVALDEHDELDWSVYDACHVADRTVLVPCRKCLGCKRREARDWAIRVYHESLMHWHYVKDPVSGVTTRVPKSVFLTLTYSDDFMPENRLLVPEHFTAFIKRLRKKRDGLRFFGCGEYGTISGRPHYHVVLLNCAFDDRYDLGLVKADETSYQGSFELDKLWKMGIASVADFTIARAFYTAGYVTKKTHTEGNFTGPLAEVVDEVTGEMSIQALEPEFRRMSTKPGIGYPWLEANYERVYPADKVDIDNQELPPPVAYDRWLKAHHPDLYLEVQAKRLDGRIESQLEWTDNRVRSAFTINSQRSLRQDSI